MPNTSPHPDRTKTGGRSPNALLTLLFFSWGFAVAFWLWAKWLFAPQLFLLPPLPPVEVLVSMVERAVGPVVVAAFTFSSLIFVAVEGWLWSRAGRLGWWSKSILRGTAESVVTHVAVWAAGTVVFFGIMAVLPGAEIRGKSANDPVLRGLLLFTAFLSLIMAGPITALIAGVRQWARQRRERYPETLPGVLNHTLAILFVPLFSLWIISGYPQQALEAVRHARRDAKSKLIAELVTAAREGNSPTVQKLIRRGAQVNEKDSVGTTALIVAAANSCPECVRTLIEAGADVNIQDAGWRDALMSAAANRQAETAEILLRAGARPQNADLEGKTALMLSASAGDAGIAGRLIRSGAEINRASASGETALMAAARQGRLEVVRVLLASGADLGLKSQTGETALTLALKYGHTEAASVLRAAGARH